MKAPESDFSMPHSTQHRSTIPGHVVVDLGEGQPFDVKNVTERREYGQNTFCSFNVNYESEVEAKFVLSGFKKNLINYCIHN